MELEMKETMNPFGNFRDSVIPSFKRLDPEIH